MSIVQKKEKALKILDQLIKNHLNFIEPFHLYANICEDLKRYDESEKIYKLRLKLRRQVADSPLCNGLRFAKNFENAMEKIFCE